MACRGCGLLRRISAHCPALESIDATFCGQLDGAGLATLVGAAPRLHSLLLSVCESLAPNALHCLTASRHLRLLDLSYTEIEVRLAGCTALHVNSCATHATRALEL